MSKMETVGYLQEIRTMLNKQLENAADVMRLEIIKYNKTVENASIEENAYLRGGILNTIREINEMIDNIARHSED